MRQNAKSFFLVLFSLLPFSARGAVRITATTPPVEDGRVHTWAMPLAGALLGGRVGLFWGTIPGHSVNEVCDILVNQGSQTKIPIKVTGFGHTITDSVSVKAIGGCRASSQAPAGVQAVLKLLHAGTDAAVICHEEHTAPLGCEVYMTGADAKAIYEKLKAEGHRLRKLQSCPDTRPECPGWGPSQCSTPGVGDICPCMCGRVPSPASTPAPSPAPASNPAPPPAGDVGECAGGVTASVAGGTGCALGCAATGPLYPVCLAACAAGAVGGSVGSCHSYYSGCFPGHARVLLKDGREVRMEALELGDEVAVRLPDRRGTLSFEAIYAWGHRSESVAASLVQIQLEPSLTNGNHSSSLSRRMLELTPDHFVLLRLSEHQSGTNYKRARDVKPGDVMWVLDDTGDFQLSQVVAARTFMAQGAGLHNPYTLSGNIVVEGVAVSCHSGWFADEAIDVLGLSPAWLPPLYQASLAPVRALYQLWGKAAYVDKYMALDGECDIAATSNAGGITAVLGLVARAVLSA